VYTAAILTISDSAHQGTREDLSGPAIVAELKAAGFQIAKTAIVPDEQDQIQEALKAYCREAKLVVTVGGTGIATRDVTPEATLAIVDRVVPGIAELMRAIGALKTPLAALSRGVCGIRGQALILNLPGSPKAAMESLQAVIEVLPHALELIGGNTEHR
jgi:molybdopterin adenylyltransferase